MSQSHGDVTIIEKITTTGANAVRVQVQDSFGGAIQPYYGQFLFFKVD
ncbi:MAG: hypothetical protein QG650_836 [Patescibacteria group bacterium]|nr:hypothetical protein [Patescibacteria group bacterium]